ncbi:putative tail fiber protein [Aeromonas phage 25AhydR2PP]|uniref:Tail fiber protein n=1 Tax=Aeromonas phage 25AhydR2PP TaxID=2163976 RepID=A0A2S1PFQ3_9CAUD|nr:tail fiber protein [Aeromonas phage 25AhydR2PP]AWH15403.1 putative tail fiber protein [Aeromonas phage 25AhydR2PP]
MNVYSQWFDVLRVGNHYNTMQYFAGTGGDTFEINFSGGYLDKSHVKALADDEGPELTLTFITKSRIKLSRPIMPGSNVLIFRDTPKVVPLAMFSDGAIINSINLDRNAKQAVFVAAEMLDRFDTFGSSLETSVSQVSEALSVANEALNKAIEAERYSKSVLGVAESAKVESAEAFTKAFRAYNVTIGETSYRLKWNGFTLVGSFEDGAVVRSVTDAVVQLETGKVFKYTGTIPPEGLTVTAGDLPSSKWSNLDVYSTAREMREGYAKLEYARRGTFLEGGFRIVAGESAALHSDGLYYSPISGFRDISPGSSPDSGMVCVGTLKGVYVDCLSNWVVGDITMANKAIESKSVRGGGVIRIPVGDFKSAETVQLRDFVQLRGISRRRSRITNHPTFSGNVLVHATKGSLGSSDVPEYLSYSGISQCTVFASGSVKVGVYVRHCTNEADFTKLTTQGFSEVNLYVIGCFYCDFSGSVSRDAMRYGMIFGRKMYSEGGLNEVNACTMNNIRSNYSGVEDKYNPSEDMLNGAGITLWSANACALDYVGAENSFGVGIVIRRGINSTIQTAYLEANGRSAAAVDKIGLAVISADFPQLLISNLMLTRNQRVHLAGGAILNVGNIYSESFESGLILGNGQISLESGLYANRMTPADIAKVINKELNLHGAIGNVGMSSYSTLDSSIMVSGSIVSNIRIVMVPSVTITTTDPIIIGIAGTEIAVNFGNSFTAGVPIEKVISGDVPKGIYRLRHRSNSLPSASTNLTAAFAVGVYCIKGFPLYSVKIGG